MLKQCNSYILFAFKMDRDLIDFEIINQFDR